MESNNSSAESIQCPRGVSAFSGTPMLRRVCLSVLALSLIVSLVGPCLGYWQNVDRDLERLARFVDGDWHPLIEGHRAPLFGQTLGGLFFLVLAPFYIISSNTAWLYGVIAALVFLSVIPLWYVARRICGSPVAWIACTIYAVSFGRVFSGNLGIHSYMSLLPVMLFHLVLLRVVAQPTICSIIGALLLCLASLSLHLSSLPLLLIAPLIVLVYRWPLLTSQARTICKMALALVGIAILGYGLWKLPAKVEHFSQEQAWQNAVCRVRNTVRAVESVTSFRAAMVGDGAWVDLDSRAQRVWHGDGILRAIPPIFLLIGVVTLLRPPPDWVVRRMGMPCGRALRLARTWVLLSTSLQILIAGTFVPNWSVGGDCWQTYRNIIPAVGPLQILMAIGVVRLALLVRSNQPSPATVIAILLLLVAGHAGSLARLYSSCPLRLARYPISDGQFAVIAGLSSRWAIDREWLTSCSYTEPTAIGLSPYQIRTWSEVSKSRRGRPLRLGHVLILAKSGSVLDRAIKVQPQAVLDAERAGDHIGYICVLSITRSHCCPNVEN